MNTAKGYNFNPLLKTEFSDPKHSGVVIANEVTKLTKAIVNASQRTVCHYICTPRQKTIIEGYVPNTTFTATDVVAHGPLKYLRQQLDYKILNYLKPSVSVGFIGTSYAELAWYHSKATLPHWFAVFGNLDGRDSMRINEGVVNAQGKLSSNKEPIRALAASYLKWVEDDNFHYSNHKHFSVSQNFKKNNRKATVLVMNHALYDVSPVAIADYIAHTGARMMYAQFLCYPDLVNDMVIRDTDFQITWERKGKKIHMYHDSSELGYVHEAKTYLLWASRSAFEVPQGVLMVEREASFGTLQLLKISLVDARKTILTRTIDTVFVKYAKIHDPVTWIRYGRKDVIFVDRDKLCNIFNFAVRQQASEFDIPKLYAHAAAKLNQFRISDAEVQTLWECSQYVVNKTVEFVIFAAILQKGEAFRILQATLEASKAGGRYKDLLPSGFEVFCTEIMDWFGKTKLAQFMGWSNKPLMEDVDEVFQIDYNRELTEVEGFRCQDYYLDYNFEVPDDMKPVITPVYEICLLRKILHRLQKIKPFKAFDPFAGLGLDARILSEYFETFAMEINPHRSKELELSAYRYGYKMQHGNAFNHIWTKYDLIYVDYEHPENLNDYKCPGFTFKDLIERHLNPQVVIIIKAPFTWRPSYALEWIRVGKAQTCSTDKWRFWILGVKLQDEYQVDASKVLELDVVIEDSPKTAASVASFVDAREPIDTAALSGESKMTAIVNKGFKLVTDPKLEFIDHTFPKQHVLVHLNKYYTKTSDEESKMRIDEEKGTLATLKDSVKGLIKKCIGIMNSQPDLRVKLCNMDMVYGSGKTKFALKHYDPKNWFWIVSKRELRNDTESAMRTILNLPSHVQTNVWTFETALTKNLSAYDFCVIDEFYTFELAYFYTLCLAFTAGDPKSRKCILTLGDSNQCSYYNPESRDWAKIQDNINAFKGQRCNLTYRCGPAVSAIVNSCISDYNVVSREQAPTTQVRLIPYSDYLEGYYNKNADLHMAPSEHTVKLIKGCKTVSSVQGFDVKTANLYLTSVDAALMKTPGEFIVSMSRAKDRLDIVEVENGAFVKTLPVSFRPLLETLAPYVPSDARIKRLGTQVETLNSDPNLKSCDFSANLAYDQVMQVMENVNEVHRVDIPVIANLRAVGTAETVTSKKTYKYVKLLGKKWLGRDFRVSNLAQRDRTGFARLARNYSMKISNTKIDHLISKFKRIYFKKDYKVTDFPEQMTACMQDLVNKYSASGTAAKIDIENRYQVLGHLKTIVKQYVDDVAKLQGGKAGQLISAWPVEFNAIFGPFFRAMMEAFKARLNPNTVYANGLTEAEMEFNTQAFFETWKQNEGKVHCADMPEYDASQNKDTNRLEEQIMKQLIFIMVTEPMGIGHLRDVVEETLLPLWKCCRSGMPIFIGDWFFPRDNQFPKDSGGPDTFSLNTILLMALCAMVIEIPEYKFGWFGGDDSMVLSTVCSEKTMVSRWTQNGFKIKYDDAPVPVFFNQMFTSGCRFYSPMLLIYKLLSKNFNNGSKIGTLSLIRDYQRGIEDKVKTYRKHYGIVLQALRSQHNIGQEQAEIIMEQLAAFVRCPPEKVLEQCETFEVEL